MPYFVYILQSKKDGSYYVGHTDNLMERLNRHNQGRSAYTRNKLPWNLVYQEVFSTKALAARREREIKGKKNKTYITFLISG